MRKFISILCLFLSFTAVGQQDPFLIGDAMLTPVWHNPASFGTRNKFSVNTLGGFYSAIPDVKSNFFLINSEFKFGYKKKDKMSYDLTKVQSGTGINFYFDEILFQRTTSLSVNYNLQVKLSNHARLSFGLSLGFHTITFNDVNWVPPTNVPDPNLPPNGSQTKFTIGAGIMYYSRKSYLGISSTHLSPPTFEEVNFTAARHYYLNAGHQVHLSRKISLNPSLNLGYDGASLYGSTLLLGMFNKHYIAGLGYAIGGSFRGMLGCEVKNFLLQYFVNYNTNPFVSTHFGHEIRFSYKIYHAPGCLSCNGW